MADLHIDDFCRDTAKALVLLYNRFPQRSILYVEDIAGPDTPDEFGLHSPRFQAGFNTLLWLAETGYLSFKQTVRQEAIEEATLSHRSFLFLSGLAELTPEHLLPSHATNTLTRIDLLRETLQSRSSDQLRNLVLHYMNACRAYQ